jgi:hypothetical protein
VLDCLVQCLSDAGQYEAVAAQQDAVRSLRRVHMVPYVSEALLHVGRGVDALAFIDSLTDDLLGPVTARAEKTKLYVKLFDRKGLLLEDLLSWLHENTPNSQHFVLSAEGKRAFVNLYVALAQGWWRVERESAADIKQSDDHHVSAASLAMHALQMDYGCYPQVQSILEMS